MKNLLLIALLLSAICVDCDAATKPTDRRTFDVYRQLDEFVDVRQLKVDTTFSQAVQIIRNSTTPRMNIVVLWNQVHTFSTADENSPIGMNGVDRIPAKTALELVLRAVAPRPDNLTFTVVGGTVVIGARGSLPVKMYTRVYNVSDLVAAPSYGGFVGFGGIGFGLGIPSNLNLGANRYGTGGNNFRSNSGYRPGSYQSPMMFNRRPATGRRNYAAGATRGTSSYNQRRTYASRRGRDLAETIRDSVAPGTWR